MSSFVNFIVTRKAQGLCVCWIVQSDHCVQLRQGCRTIDDNKLLTFNVFSTKSNLQKIYFERHLFLFQASTTSPNNYVIIVIITIIIITTIIITIMMTMMMLKFIPFVIITISFSRIIVFGDDPRNTWEHWKQQNIVWTILNVRLCVFHSFECFHSKRLYMFYFSECFHSKRLCVFYLFKCFHSKRWNSVLAVVSDMHRGV